MLEAPTTTHPWWANSSNDPYDPPPLATTPLDPLESSGTDDHSLATTFRHSGWARQRRKVYEALNETNQKASRREAFNHCGSTCHVFRSKSDPTEIKIAATCCHDRFCLPCAQTRSRTIAANVQPLLQRAHTRFITLTLKHTKAGLTTELERLYDGFRKLRKTPIWKTTQRGGAAFLEIKRSRDRSSWHPHFHVLSQGKFIDAVKLGRQWLAITGDSYIVDVRSVNDEKHALDYVTKYASKPFDATLFEHPWVLQEAMVALAGRRMVISFGNWKGLQMTDKPSEDAWEFLDTLEGLVYKALTGDTAAENILRAALGARTDSLLKYAKNKPPPRMNATRPPTPNPEMYLIHVEPKPIGF